MKERVTEKEKSKSKNFDEQTTRQSQSLGNAVGQPDNQSISRCICTTLRCTAVCCAVLYCTITALYYTELNCTVLLSAGLISSHFISSQYRSQFVLRIQVFVRPWVERTPLTVPASIPFSSFILLLGCDIVYVLYM